MPALPQADATAMIRTVDMRVDYDDITAVQDMNLSIHRGEVFGLIGPNGAGKTSTIKVLATLQQPTYGDVYVGGIDVAEQAGEVHKILGYMPDFAPVYDDLKVWEFLDVFAASYFVRKPARRERIDALLREVELFEKRDVKAGGLSRGMKQRLCLAKTMLHDPQVLLLDEPASGIDPMGRIKMRELLKRLGSEGKTVLISSHILTEMSDFCTSIGIMERGRMVEHGRVEDIIHRMQSHVRLIVEVVEVHEMAVTIAKAQPGVADAVATDHRIEVSFTGGEAEASDLLAALVRERVKVKAFYRHKLNVEDILLKVGAREVS
jgi:ABC-2 type transport system ATP-binding protein